MTPSALPRGNDGHLVQRVGFFTIDIADGVARLVIGGFVLFVVGQHHALALHAHEHLVLCFFKVKHGDLFLAEPGRHERRFVDQVGKVRAHEPRRSARDGVEVDVGGKRDVFRVDLQNAFACP